MGMLDDAAFVTGPIEPGTPLTESDLMAALKDIHELFEQSVKQGLGGPLPNGGILIEDRAAWDALHDGDQMFLHDKKTPGKPHRHARGKLVKIEKRWWDAEQSVGCLVYWFLQGPLPASEV